MGRCSRLADVWARVGRPGPTVSVRCGCGAHGTGVSGSWIRCVSLFRGEDGCQDALLEILFFFSRLFSRPFSFCAFFYIGWLISGFSLLMMAFLWEKRWGFHVGAIMAVLFCDVGGK